MRTIKNLKGVDLAPGNKHKQYYVETDPIVNLPGIRSKSFKVRFEKEWFNNTTTKIICEKVDVTILSLFCSLWSNIKTWIKKRIKK